MKREIKAKNKRLHIGDEEFEKLNYGIPESDRK